jgi:uroporphyrinogen-III decarboxylase
VSGINERTFADRSPEEIAAEVREALDQTGGLGHVVAPGCVLPVDAPEANLEAVVRAGRS